MLLDFLLPECIAREDGNGPAFELGSKRGKLLVLTLGITCILERESLEMSVRGSTDGQNWELEPLASFRPKFYCGTYSILLNTATRPDIESLRVHWKMSRWTKDQQTPMFGFYVYAEESGARVKAAVA